MKRFVVWFLLVVMLFTGLAVAEDKPYAWVIPAKQLGNPFYTGRTAITPETYPKVLLTLRRTTNDNLVFDPPADAVLVDMSYFSVQYEKPAENGYNTYIRYSISSNYDGPTDFQQKESSKKILSVTETRTTFVDEWGYLRGYIALPEYGEKISLDISVDGENKMQVFKEEMARLQTSSIHQETLPPYWSYGMFQGVKLTDFMDTDYTVRFDFPTLAELGSYGKRVDFVVTDLSADGNLEGYYILDNGEQINLTVSLKSSKPFIYKSDDAFDVQATGNVWKVRGDLNAHKTEEIFRAFEMARPLPNTKDGQERYLDISFSNSIWDAYDWTRNSICRIVETLEGKIAVLNASDNPYIPADALEAEAIRAAEEAKRAAEEEAAIRAAEEMEKIAAEKAAMMTTIEPDNVNLPAEENAAWTCPDCGFEGNGGNFCTNCGAKRPEPEPDPLWICPGCGHDGNNGNFCSNCGAKRPELSFIQNRADGSAGSRLFAILYVSFNVQERWGRPSFRFSPSDRFNPTSFPCNRESVAFRMV